MSATKQEKSLLQCPHCGHQQPGPRTAFSAVCKKCGQYFRVQDVAKVERKAPEAPPERRRLTCFDCGTELEVAVNAQSTMCKRCSRHIDLLDYSFSVAVSRNFKTKGTFVIQPKGYVFNSEAIVGEAVIRGRFLGKLIAERSLTIYSNAEIKGTFTTGCLIIPAGNIFRWKDPLKVGSAEIAGELIADLRAEKTITVSSTGRLFGRIDAGGLTVEAGGVAVGETRIGAGAISRAEWAHPEQGRPASWSSDKK
jgi:cytoskeletal protein CcmA (bactofilin family)